MPISYNKQPATLQEKVDKAIRLTYQIHDLGDSEFLRAFLIALIEKAYTKLELGESFDEINRIQE